MSRRLDIYCDAPKCNQKKEETNNWWVVRHDTGSSFTFLPMHGHHPEDGDYHICGPKCLHDIVEDHVQSYLQRVTTRPGVQIEETTIDHNE